MIRKELLKVSFIILITLVMLEFLLLALGIGTYYPTEIPEKWLEPVPWYTCDNSGCHYVYDKLPDLCNEGNYAIRGCIVNRQGRLDTEDFVAIDDGDARMRILMLGDSFTVGHSADMGKSYVEIVETNFPDSLVWNTAISATGTNHALASFETYAAMLKPHISVLGFVMNDFDDNATPIDSYLVAKNIETNALLRLRQYRIDLWGNVIKLDHQSDLYYRKRDVDPPANEFERLVGMTRLGTLVLRMLDTLGAVFFDDARFNRKVEITREYLQKLRDRAADHRSALLVVLVPKAENVDSDSERYRVAIQLMRELEIAYIDPIDALGAEDYAPAPDNHWNNAGHQKVGAMVSACLEVYFAGGDLSDCEHVGSP
ncbi:MAG: hypothetical protein OXG39_17765 [Chloroflexi bacterium]|nr:hypothetical protein [Chloroflexota bacterium]